MEIKSNIYKKLFEIKKVGIKLQRDTKAFNYKYATLSQIQDKLSGELEKQGLLVIHKIYDNKVITRIVDIEADGTNQLSEIQSEITLSENIKPQDKGSEITYYRRYNLLSLLDLEVEDDDGKMAQESNSTGSAYYKGKLDVMDYVTRVKEESDVNALDTIYKEFMEQKPSDKQKAWLIKECKERKIVLTK